MFSTVGTLKLIRTFQSENPTHAHTYVSQDVITVACLYEVSEEEKEGGQKMGAHLHFAANEVKISCWSHAYDGRNGK